MQNYPALAQRALDEGDAEIAKLKGQIAGMAAKIEWLRAALVRLGSSEGITGTFAIAEGQTGDELKARIQFARDTLEQEVRDDNAKS